MARPARCAAAAASAVCCARRPRCRVVAPLPCRRARVAAPQVTWRVARAPDRQRCALLARAAAPQGSSAPPEAPATPRAEDELACVATGTDVSCVIPEDAPADQAVAAAEAAPDLDLAGLLLLLLPFFLWGTSMAAMKVVLPHTSSLFVAASRLLPSGAALVAFAAARGRAQPSGAAAWGAVALFGLVDGTAFQGCLAQGLERTSAGLGSVIIDSQPLTVAILAAMLFGERVSAPAAGGLLLGVLGLLVLELPADATAGGVGAAALAALSDSPPLLERGEVWMLLAAQAMAVGTVMVRWVVRLGVDPVMATGWHMLLGGAPLLALSLAREPELYARVLAQGGLSSTDLGLLFYASFFGGAVAYAAFFSAATRGSLVRLSTLTFLTPVFATAAGYLALGETLTQQQLLGAAITLAGISLVTLKQDSGKPEGAQQ